MSACSSSIGSPAALQGASVVPHIARPASSASSPAASSSRAVSVASGSALPVRTACEACRTRKLKCDGVQPACSRCRDEERECVFATRKPIGRPKKRKGQEASSSQPDGAPHAEAVAKRVKAEAAQRDSLPPNQGAARASCCSEVAGDSRPSPATSSSSRMTVDPRELAAGMALSPRSTASSSRTSVSGEQALLRPPRDEVRHSTSPSLDNLAVAAFLNSLDSLEIGSSDGLTSGMLDAWTGAPPASPRMQGGTGAPDSLWGLPNSVVDSQVSYAVPSDFSWWAPDWLDNVPPPPPPSLPPSKETAPAPTAALRPDGSSSSSSSWPRGKDAGMGSGRIETEQGAILEGQGWEKDPDPTLVQPADAKPCEVTGAAKCCCSGKATAPAASGAQPGAAAAASAAAPSAKGKQRVHCVPNPSGKGCTCLCDVSVALLNVRGTLRAAASPGAAATASTPAASQSAGTTLHLTLSASQAVAAQCACSADCPTCRSDPSTQLSAGLLISTALQIYARAVSTLRRGFGASSPSSSSSIQSGSGAPDWDIRIGGYTPSPSNARRIALFAMKLELRDLRDAIGKVSRLAGIRSPPADDAAPAGADGLAAPAEAINPVDQIVIRKLHQQLGELLRTVEALEGQG